jgi:4-hydroxy-3-methylbut-2-en-1-yl diphosphate reductase
MKILLAQPRGFCAGVSRAIDIVLKVLDKEENSVYVRHEVVHNKYVVDKLKQKGAIFIKELDEIPNNSTVIFSAHGVSAKVQNDAINRNLNVYDATCPLVTKVHRQVQKADRASEDCILIGHKGHPEVEGTLGQYRNSDLGGKIHLVETQSDIDDLNVNKDSKLNFVTQTTLSLDETKELIAGLKHKFPTISSPKKEDICYATQNRQNAVRDLAKAVDVILVVGSKNSSNSNRLNELAKKCGVESYLIDGPDDVKLEWLDGYNMVGLTAGASAPETLVNKVIEKIQIYFKDAKVELLDGVRENTHFPLPKGLKP